MAGAKVVFIDFENIQPTNLERLRDRDFTLRVFLGATQDRIPVRIANALQVFGTSLEYVQICGKGPNALDFHIAYFLGRDGVLAPDTEFFVLSNDTGFDSLLQFLRNDGICARRVTSVSEILDEGSTTEPIQSVPVGELLQKVIYHLIKRASTRPRTLKTLRSCINSLFSKKLLAAQLDELLAELTKRGVISEGSGKIRYALGPGDKPTPSPRSSAPAI